MKCELHLHLDGSLRPSTVKEYLNDHNRSLEEITNKLRVPDNCESLTEYLKRFEIPTLILQSPKIIERVTFELIEDLTHLGIDYAEIRFAPQLHTHKGTNQEEIIKAAIRGVEKGKERYPQTRIGLILCMMRLGNNTAQNLETVALAKKFYGTIVCGLDIAGPEALYPTDCVTEELNGAQASGVPLTIHAGEVGNEKSLRDALAYKTTRIGHGFLAAQFPDIIDQIIKNDVTLEICVSSNYQTKGITQLSDHPIRQLYDAGVKIALSSDNMTVSNTNLWKEEQLIKQHFGFTDKDIKQLDLYAEEARFLQ